jgi:AraC-like DNA-binding protein
MDPLTYFFDGPRASRAFALCMQMGSPWGIDIEDGAALTVVAVTRGAAVIDGTRLDSGDVALVRGPEPYRVTDVDDTAPDIRIGPGQECTTTDGVPLHDEFRRGVRRWGNADGGDTELLVGTYERPDHAGGFVTRALPRLVVAPRHHTDIDPVVGVLVRELAADDPAAQVVIDRLLDVLVIGTVRRWLHDADRPAGTTWLTCTDPVVVRALAGLHAEPAAPWTVEKLARSVDVSRASLAARFRAGVGEPPMAHLTRWRLTLAADLLQAPDARVGEVARSVGYDNAFAFSTAFRRHLGTTPTEYRRGLPALSR